MKNFSNPDGLVREDFKGGWTDDKVNKFTPQGRTEKENEAFDYFKKIANYRKDNKVLQTGKLMQYVPENGIYVYFRYNAYKTVMVIVNSNEKEQSLVTDRFEERMNSFTKAVNVISDETLNSIQIIKVAAKTAVVLELQK
jgi:glycosidase